MTVFDDIFARTPKAKSDGDWTVGFCPVHEAGGNGHKRSLRFRRADLDDSALVCCMAGCGAEKLQAALGFDEGVRVTPTKDPNTFLFCRPSNGGGERKLVETYDYTDEAGELLFQVCRYEPKDFRQRRPDGKGGWTWRLGDVRRVLYHLPRVLDAVKSGEMVYVVEGEKDVETLERLGIVATCNAGGAGKWRAEYSDVLKGAKLVAILPDNDEPGCEHAARVAKELRRRHIPAVVVELPGLPPKGDVSDWVARGGTKAQLEALVKATLETASADEEPDDDAIGGRIDWASFWAKDREEAEWLHADVLARGRGHALFASGKEGKSLLALYLAALLATSKDPVVVVYLDYEMSEADVRERLEDMGYGPESDLSRFHYHLWPSLAALDTAEGGQTLATQLDAYRAERPDHHMAVFIDTMSRAVEGKEDAADTVRSFYSNTGIELKRRGITWLRLDHAGKEPSREQRGTSAKGDDVDLVWSLTKTNNGVLLKRVRSRMAWVPEKVTFGVCDGPLAYRRLTTDYPAGTAELANILDRLNLPLNVSRPKAEAALKTIKEGRSHTLVTAALRFRRDRLQ
jgi:hypothetical protein